MLTPQDIQSKEFTKAVFGGYDMSAVDDFLEELTENYSALYKDNAVLKGKLKVLVEKVEEYRSTEDAMRMALLTAQKMSDDMVEETQKKCDEMIAAANRQAEETKAKLASQFEEEQQKLQEAKEQTASFIRASKQVMEQYAQFLAKLEGVVQEYAPQEEPAEKNPAEGEPIRSPEPEPGMRSDHKEEPQAAEGAQSDAPAPDREVEMDDTIKEIDDFVAGVMEESKTGKNGDMSAETRRLDPEEMARAMSNKKKDWNEEDELTTPRPKFDFSDLKFGKNYKDE